MACRDCEWFVRSAFNPEAVTRWGYCGAPLPDCMTKASKEAMEEDEGDGCPCYQPKQGESNE